MLGHGVGSALQYKNAGKRCDTRVRKEVTYWVTNVRTLDESLTHEYLLVKGIHTDCPADHISIIGHEICMDAHIGGKNCHREQLLEARAGLGTVKEIAQAMVAHEL